MHHHHPTPEPHTPASDETLASLLQGRVPLAVRRLQPGEVLLEMGQSFSELHLVAGGAFKSMQAGPSGHLRITALYQAGDWLGFEGIAHGTHAWRVVALEGACVRSVDYETLLCAARKEPQLLLQLQAAMAHEVSRHRLASAALRRQATEARVTQFLLSSIEHSDTPRGSDAALIHIPLHRAEMGELLGMTLESVSRSLSRLASKHLIEFVGPGHRCVLVPDVNALRCVK